mmetsp:Transcript_23482/g.73513  ORF Transcript_23482/g.73513 Transcript_23482/m.73513 type:complete len:384 (+) Transcript_23482:61-1212(+)
MSPVRLVALIVSVARSSGTRIVYWYNARFDLSQLRVAGLLGGKAVMRGKSKEYHSHNSCRRQGCEFVGVRVQKALDTAVQIAQSADVLVVAAQLLQNVNNRATLDLLIPPRAPGVRKPLRILYWREGAWNVPRDVQEKFDGSMGVHFTSSIMNPSFFPRPVLFNELDRAMRQPQGSTLSSPPPFDSRSRLAYVMITNCHAEPRTSYLAALRKLIQIDEYGKCSTTQSPFKAAEKELQSRLSKLPVLSRHDISAMAHAAVGRHYKFYFAFENTLAEGYVTEKLLLNPLMSGAIPVYMGAPDLPSRFASLDGLGDSWYIDILDFDTPHDLVGQLRRVAPPDSGSIQGVVAGWQWVHIPAFPASDTRSERIHERHPVAVAHQSRSG